MAPGGFGYLDAQGNELGASGNHVVLSSDTGSPEQVQRSLNQKIGSSNETVWVSVLLQGSSADELNNLALGSSYAEVAPYTHNPEPNTALLTGLGMTMLPMRRRRAPTR